MTGPSAPFDPGLHGKHMSLRDVARQIDVWTLEQMVATQNIRKALRDLEAAVWAEDARMRSEVLPSPPEGWEWRSDLVTSEDLVSAGVKIRLQYHLEEVRHGSSA